MFDLHAGKMRDKGWNGVGGMIASGITELLRQSKLRNAVVTRAFFGLCIAGQKR
ncbi:hypothetical protein [Lacrimispora sp.]|uniref:hypothetical protein n=1 Tax=Lacrimispora sp. TaxID=2719234 RepID=UPI0028A9054C|nr:hypothetical protein [Lacrimispora sp.]